MLNREQVSFNLQVEEHFIDFNFTDVTLFDFLLYGLKIKGSLDCVTIASTFRDCRLLGNTTLRKLGLRNELGA